MVEELATQQQVLLEYQVSMTQQEYQLTLEELATQQQEYQVHKDRSWSQPGTAHTGGGIKGTCKTFP